MHLDGMSRGRLLLVGVLGAFGTLWAASCQGPQEFFRDSGVVNLGSGGIVSTGGQGASTSTGGVTGTGGVVVGTGGTPATGGVTGTGGVATGGITGTGGKATGGVTGTGGVATGGITGTGGKATGGITGTGGVATGGITGTGGVATGGITGTGGTATGVAGSTGTAANCVDAIKMAGYVAGSQSCAACKDNNTSQASICEMVVDCLDKMYPCTGNCQLGCYNSAGASGVVMGCVSALLSAATCM